MQNTQAINVKAGSAVATGSVTVSDSIPGVPCPDPAGYKYVGARYVPLFAEPAEWNINSTYEPLTIVLNEGNSYTSKQYVPVGIQIDNEEYWAQTGNYNAQVEQYRKEVQELFKVSARSYPTVEIMKEGDLAEGNTVFVQGYYSQDDGGEGFYVISSKNTTGSVQLNNGLFANIINSGYINIVRCGAKCDGITDDTKAFSDAFELSDMVEVPAKKVGVSSITIESNKHLKGAGQNTVLVGVKENSDIIFVQGENTSVKDLSITSNKAGVNGVVVGNEDNFAQNCQLDSILVEGVSGDGFLVRQSNNSSFINLSAINNIGNGFNLKPTHDVNINGNYIVINDCYGNNNGCVVNGEGNFIYVCSQSNTNDNIVNTSWMNGCMVVGYTEFAANGYEIDLKGNCFNNTFIGVYRTKTNKQFKSVTNLPNNLMFSTTNSAEELGSQTIPRFLTNNSFSGKTPISLFTIPVGKTTVAISQTNTKIPISGMESFIAPEDFTLSSVAYYLKEPITAGIITLRVTKNGSRIINETIQSTTGQSHVYNYSISISKGDLLSIDYITYSDLAPQNNEISIVFSGK